MTRDEMFMSSASVRALVAEAWPGTTVVGEPAPLTGGFWASMYRLRLEGQPAGVPTDVVLRVAPSASMGAKELAVQKSLAELGYPTPAVRFIAKPDVDGPDIWSLMDFAAGTPPLNDLNGLSALLGARALLNRIPTQLAMAMADLHAVDPTAVSQAVAAAAPDVVWSIAELLQEFAAAADRLGRSDLVSAVRALADRQPAPGRTVICHGDLHPFNVLVDAAGQVTVIDWTGAIRAEPAYDVAFTALLLGHPPMAAPRLLRPVIGRVGARLERNFITGYLANAPQSDLSRLDWYRALHGVRMLIEVDGSPLRPPLTMGEHPFQMLAPVAVAAIEAVSGMPLSA